MKWWKELDRIEKIGFFILLPFFLCGIGLLISIIIEYPLCSLGMGLFIIFMLGLMFINHNNPDR